VKHNRLKIAHPEYEPSGGGGFWFGLLWISIIVAVVGLVGGFVDSSWYFTACAPVTFFVGWFALMLNHEAAFLEGEQLKLYDEYRKLQAEMRKALPRLTTSQIEDMDNDACHAMRVAFEDLRLTEEKRRRAEKALDPFLKDMVRAIGEQQKTVQQETITLNELRKELDK
jgi:hypothetical protein